MVLKKKPILADIARDHITSVKCFTEVEKIGRVNEKLAEEANLSHMQLHKIEKLVEKASPEVVENVRGGRMSINKAYNKVQRDTARESMSKENPKIELPDNNFQILNDDLNNNSKLPDNSIDLIFSDPPYDKNSTCIRRNSKTGNESSKARWIGSTLCRAPHASRDS